jgi:hypothetical protein
MKLIKFVFIFTVSFFTNLFSEEGSVFSLDKCTPENINSLKISFSIERKKEEFDKEVWLKLINATTVYANLCKSAKEGEDIISPLGTLVEEFRSSILQSVGFSGHLTTHIFGEGAPEKPTNFIETQKKILLPEDVSKVEVSFECKKSQDSNLEVWKNICEPFIAYAKKCKQNDFEKRSKEVLEEGIAMIKYAYLIAKDGNIHGSLNLSMRDKFAGR